ncbi:MAG: anhydro-N-acetylmuramic acid kinase, partial [Hyphomicrobiales bacterium]|nr:anhydro-N-acetylmuramic acid kinase [Hyphomicrobiales bacterium]
PQSWIASGGCARNPVMLAMISDAVGMKIDAASAIGADGDFVEAQAFAYLAVRALKDWPVTFPGTTGVAKPLTGGVLRVP